MSLHTRSSPACQPASCAACPTGPPSKSPDPLHRQKDQMQQPSLIRIGVVGYGYWGPNLVRNFSEARDCQVVAVSDTRAERRALVQARYPAVDTAADYRELINDPNVDAIAIATPVS